MSKIQKIKETVSIIDLLNQYGANCDSRGKCKNNPLRAEKTCSLVAYPETNTYNDFGDDGGDVIDFICKAEGIEVHQAIEVLMRMYNIDTDDTYTPTQRTHIAPVIEKEYIKPEKIESIFEKLTVKFNKNTRDTLFTICPEYVFKEAKDDDKVQFFNLVRYYEPEKSPVVLLPNEKGVSHTFRYRYKIIDDVQKKWVAHYNTKSNYAYCNLTENNFTLVVEGSRDYLSALLCGYSVIALPSSGFKPSNELFKDRLCIFIDDDDGKNSMKELYESAICEKIFFNHSKFKEITKCNSKDFSDYLYQFDNLEKFKHTFEKFIYENEVSDSIDWKQEIFKITQPITKKDIENVENQEFLYPELLIKRNITTLVSPANTGKSALVFGMSKDLLDNGSVDDVLFFDPDSSIGYVKDTINTLLDSYDGKFHYFNGVKNDKSKMMDILLAMTISKQEKNKHTLIILDGLQFFINGEISKDSNVKPFMELLQTIRDRFGATIILLHHTKRAKGDDGEVEYLGTQIIETATDNMIIGTAKNDNIFLYIKKSRSDKKNNVYSIDIDLAKKQIKNVKLKGKKDDIESQKEHKQEDFNESDILEFLEDKKVGLKQLKKRFGEDVKEILKKGLNNLWKKEDSNDKFSPNYYAISSSYSSPQITVFDEAILADIPDF